LKDQIDTFKKTRNPEYPIKLCFFEHAGTKNKENEQKDGYDKHRIKFFDEKIGFRDRLLP
jgi:hypothetical protein